MRFRRFMARHKLQVAGPLWVIIGASLVLLCWAMSRISPKFDFGIVPKAHWPTGLMVFLYITAGVLFLAAMLLAESVRPTRLAWAWMLAVGLLMRLAMFGSTPILETDYHRYFWDGAVLSHGMSPWRYAPAEVLAGHSEGRPLPAEMQALAAEGADALGRINHKNLTTIYPPLAEGGFALAHWIRPWNLEAWRAVLLLADCATLGFLLILLERLKLPPLLATRYWWCPIVAVEIFNRAHMDVLVSPLLLCALLLSLEGRAISAMGLLGLGVGVKLWPVVLAPLLLRRAWLDGQRCGLAGMVGALIAIPMVAVLVAGSGSAPAGLLAYTQDWDNNSALYRVLVKLISALQEHVNFTYDQARWIVRAMPATALLGMIGVLFKHVGEHRDLVRRSLWVVAALFLFSPTEFPWYFVWVAPLLVFAPMKLGAERALVLYVPLLPLYYLEYDHRWLVWLEHVPVWLSLLACVLAGWWTRKCPTPSESA